MSQIYKASSGGGGGSGITSITGTSGGAVTGSNVTFTAPAGNTIVGNPGTNTFTFTPAMQVIKSALINMKNVGTTTLFTLPQSFIPINLVFYGQSLAGTITPTINFNIGWTGPDYWDLTGGNASIIQATGEFIYVSGNSFQNGGTSESPFVVPAGTPIVINVTAADTTATTNNQYMYMVGYNFF